MDEKLISSNGVIFVSKALRSIVQTWYKVFFLIISAFLIIFATGCTSYIETEVTFYPNEEWRAETRLSFTPQQIVLLGGKQALEAAIQREDRK